MDNILVGKKAIKKLISGVNKMANAVKQTLGAEGKLALIQMFSKYPNSTKDGVTLLKHIKLDCPFESLGANTVLEASERMLADVGDNTTSTIVLAQELINKGFKLINRGHSFNNLKQGINQAHSETLKLLKEQARPIKTKQEILNIATISANNDSEMGKLIANAFNKVGQDGQIKVETADNTELVFQDGMKINSGWWLPHFITNTIQKTVELKNCDVLIINGSVLYPNDIGDVVNRCIEESRSLLIVADDVDDDVMRLLVELKLANEGNLKVAVIKTPSYGENKVNILQDLAIYTEGVVWDKKHSDDYQLGFAKRVIVGEDSTMISVETVSEEVKIRAKEIREQIKENPKDDNLVNRLADIENNVAIIKVSSFSTGELVEKKDRLDDAIRAVRSAIKMGYVAGGGVTLFDIGNFIKSTSFDEGEEKGFNLYCEMLQKPFKQILINGGEKPKKIIEILSKEKTGFGYNIRTKQVEDFYKTGVIDSVETIIASLNNSKSVAETILSTNVLVINEKI